MISITLPDGSARQFESGSTGGVVAAAIGPGLAKAALAIRLDGELVDLATPIERDAAIEIVTSKSPDALELLRHGFFYDFARETPFTPEDLETIEARMHEIVKRDEAVIREVWDRDEAVAFFKDQGELYKAEIIADLPEGEAISLYRQGDFIDLCRGPHLPSTARLGKAFKLMKLAGAYWRGDSNNPMLQRIYGTAWANTDDLAAYLHRIEEAERRDHRRLGREMELFHFQDEAVGMVFWHPNGWTLYRGLKDYVRRKLTKAGYGEVNTPQLVDRVLWENSGHWEKFRENMFTSEVDDRTFALKPMNCPCHVQIFRQGLKSYRDLPLRMAEFGACHRYEPSGALHGLMRVRGFTQDDAHIFCTEDQINSESAAFCGLALGMYRDFGFEDVVIRFADRPAVRAGSDEVWDRAEEALRNAAQQAGVEYELNPGDGAFYGPKLDFVLRDAIGREWQCGTLQADFVLPERLDASYIGEDGEKHRPVMLHRAILGSIERFTGVLIEHYAGRFPLWLAPVQVVAATITHDGNDYAAEVIETMTEAGLRAALDISNEKIGYKVRHHSVAKVPVLLAIGKREAEERTVSVRRLGSKEQEVLALDDAVARLTGEASPPAA